MQSTAKTIVLDNKTYSLPKLTIRDLFSIGDEFVASREALARKLAKEENLDRYEIINIVNQIRANRPSVADLVGFASTPEGVNAVITKSCQKAELSDDDVKTIMDETPFDELVYTARLLASGLTDKAEAEEAKANADAAKEEEVIEKSPLSQKKSKKVSTKKKSGDEKEVGWFGKQSQE